MTIAAGFLHSEGVLLCSDSQMEGYMTKIQAPKIGMFECPGGKIGFALAGCVGFAISAIQKCAAGLQSVDPKDTIPELERILEREYVRAVFSHPDPADRVYNLLVSFWSKEKGAVSLFVTQEQVLQACYGSECIGIGLELANVLIRPFMADPIGEQDALMLAAYTLAQVKNNVPGCGGESVFISMRHDGTATPVTHLVMDQIEGIAAQYDKAAHTLLFAMADGDQSRLDRELKEFGNTSRALSAKWRVFRETNSAVSQYRRLTTVGQSHHQPSQE